MFSKSKIIEIIENDDHFNNHGRYSRDFVSDEVYMLHEYNYPLKLRKLLTFSGKEMTIFSGSLTTVVTIIADDGQQLIVREQSTEDGDDMTITEFWIVNHDRLTADIIWSYTG